MTVPDEADRQDQVHGLAFAAVENRIPEWFAATALAEDLDHAEEAAEYADLDPEAWADQKAAWAESLRERGIEGARDELADQYVRKRFGVDLERFESMVVEWPDEIDGRAARAASSSSWNR